jgi:mono/diheme cytochrome c family protein
VIFTANCVVCHAADGRGTASGADLTQHVPLHTAGTLYYWITQGLPLDSDTKRMPSFKEKLTSEEREDVVNYLRSAFGDLDAPVRPDDTPAAPSVTAE